MPTWVEGRSIDTEITEENLIGPDSHFGVAPNNEGLIIDHPSKGSISSWISDESVQLKDLVGSEGEYEAWMDHRLALGVFPGIVGGQVHVMDGFYHTEQVLLFFDVLVEACGVSMVVFEHQLSRNDALFH